jgi:hypothetical protein
LSNTCPFTDTMEGCSCGFTVCYWFGLSVCTVSFCSITKIRTAVTTAPMMPSAQFLSELPEDEDIRSPSKLVFDRT